MFNRVLALEYLLLSTKTCKKCPVTLRLPAHSGRFAAHVRTCYMKRRGTLKPGPKMHPTLRNALIAVSSMVLCCAAVVLIVLAARTYLLPLLGW